MLKILGSILRWVVTWLYFVSLTCFIGAMLGLLSHIALGPLFVDEPDFVFLAAFGFLNGLRYAGLWAGGLAIVLCVMRARKEFLAKQKALSFDASDVAAGDR